MKLIPTYIINLKSRPERRSHALKEFEGKNEFSVKIIDAIACNIGAMGLWESIKSILKDPANYDEDFILICEDDHQFTDFYSADNLKSHIANAASFDADLLSGGISWCNNAIPIKKDCFWIDGFSGFQFTIIFKKFYPKILEASFTEQDVADYKISELADKKLLIYPFISTQKNFGYSDVTPKNNQPDRIDVLFKSSADMLYAVLNAKSFYARKNADIPATDIDHDAVTIPTYIINLPERKERRHHIRQQFEGKPEFDITIIEACRHEIGAVGLWQSILKVIRLAIQNDDDVIIICEDDHEFTNDYSKEYLISNIIEANESGLDYLSGGVSKFTHAVPVSENRFWVSSCLATQFTIIYKRFFQKILDEPFTDSDVADVKLSEMTSNKMILFPFISGQRDFGYSDITNIHNEKPGLVNEMFKTSRQKLQFIKDAYIAFGDK